MLNSIIGLFRNMSDPILWKGEKLVIPSIIIAMVWQAIGYYMVMYMASMSAVPISLYAVSYTHLRWSTRFSRIENLWSRDGSCPLPLRSKRIFNKCFRIVKTQK